MTDFRDAIAYVAAGFHGSQPPHTQADAILAMPEMQTIRAALLSLAYVLRMAHESTDDTRTLLAAHGLPESVIDWVLDGAS